MTYKYSPYNKESLTTCFSNYICDDNINNRCGGIT